MRLLSLVASLLFAPLALQIPLHSQPATGRPLAIEDYYRVQTVGNPTISPDAKWVTFTVSSRVEEDNSSETSAWVVPADGSRVSVAGGALRARRLRCALGGRAARVRGRAASVVDRSGESVGPSARERAANGGDAERAWWPWRTWRWWRRGWCRSAGAAESRWQVRRSYGECRRAAAGAAGIERLRAPARRAVQGRDVRLEGFPA